MMNALAIQIWSDIACPWCWIGKRNLDLALSGLELNVAIRWRAFELNPDAPRVAPTCVDYADLLARKYQTTREQGRAFIDRMVDAGAARGLAIRFDRIRPSNTFDAHRLLAWASGEGRQTELKERLFRAYLNEGQAMSDRDVLVELAVEAGLEKSGARAVVDSDAHAADVRQDQQAARRYGISGVPCFVIGRAGLAVSGAQPPDVLAEAIRQASTN